MEILTWDGVCAATAKPLYEASVLTIGSFDGFHIGHKTLCKMVLSHKTREKNFRGKTGLVTFTRPTRSALSQKYSGDILSTRIKLKTIEDMGFDFVVLIEFTESFAKTEGEKFFSILKAALNMEKLYVGLDFACGYQHKTDITVIKEIASRLLFEVEPIKPVRIGREIVSSSLIRGLLVEGLFDEAAALLGKRFCLDLENQAYTKPNNHTYSFGCENFEQVLPKTGSYNARLNLRSKAELPVTITRTETSLCFTTPAIDHQDETFDSLIF